MAGCGCGNKLSNLTVLNIPREQILSNIELYLSLSDEEKEDFVQARYIINKRYTHLVHVISPGAIVLGFKHYGMGKYNDILWIHKEDLATNAFEPLPSAIIEQLVELETIINQGITVGSLGLENNNFVINESEEKLEIPKVKKRSFKQK